MNPLNQKIKCGNAYPKEDFTIGKINHWTRKFSRWIDLELECSTIESLESSIIEKKNQLGRKLKIKCLKSTID
jgi:hypothetical protein